MTYVEALMVVFPLLDGRDLASCMQVCRQWRDIAGDDSFWKAICAKQWPSICMRPTPFPVSYHKLFQMFCKCHRRQNYLSPRLSCDDLEFYIDVWAKEQVVFSRVFPGSILRGELPPDIYEILSLRDQRRFEDKYKMIIPVERKFSFSIPRHLIEFVSVSVHVGRMDTNKVACIVNKTYLDGFGDMEYSAEASILNFASPFYPFRFPVYPHYSLFADPGYEDIVVFAIELEFFCFIDSGYEDDLFCVSNSEEEVLWLLGMLDWD